MDLYRHLNGEIECRSLRLSGKFIWIAVIAARVSKAGVAPIRSTRTEKCFMTLQRLRVLSLDM